MFIRDVAGVHFLASTQKSCFRGQIGGLGDARMAYHFQNIAKFREISPFCYRMFHKN
jgi:hypothetical protein